MINEKLAQFIQKNTGASETKTCQEQNNNINSNSSLFDNNISENYTSGLSNSIFDCDIEDNKSSKIADCSVIDAFSDDDKSLISKLFGETKDGKIGNTKRGIIGDTSVLSAVNTINYTQKGKELIKEALQYDENGTYVNFKSTDPIYVSNAELATAKTLMQYASGDDDMTILALAVEKMRDKLANNELIYTDDKPYNMFMGVSLSSDHDSGYEAFVMYLLSGKEVKDDFQCMEDALDKFINSEKVLADGEYINKDFALGARTNNETRKVKDINGKKVKLNGCQDYSVKSADKNTVTITDPKNSSKEIVLSRDVFLNSFLETYSVDLSDNSKDVDYLIETTKETTENSDGTKTEYIKDSVTGGVLKEIEYYKNGKPKKEIKNYQNGLQEEENKHRENGKKLSRKYQAYYEDGSIYYISYTHYDKKEKFSNIISYTYNKNGSIKQIEEHELEKGERKTTEFKYYDKNGNYKSSKLMTYEDGNVVKIQKDTDGDGIYEP